MATIRSPGSSLHKNDHELLIKVCREGQTEDLRHLLVHKRIPVNVTLTYQVGQQGLFGYRSYKYTTPLSLAAECGNVSIMNMLFDHCAEANFVATTPSRNSWDWGYCYHRPPVWSPLMYAAWNGHYEAAELLILNGADVNAMDDMTPLRLAAKHGHAKLVKLLFDNGAKVQHSGDTSALILACKQGHTECARLLLEHDTDINHQKRNRDTPLTCAVDNGHTECTKMLLEKGANVHIQLDGKTPLILASERGHVEVVKLLLKYDTDINHQGPFRGTPLTCAVENGHTECTKVLLEKGADVHLQSWNGKTPLILASERGHGEDVKLLLEYDTDVNHCGRHGDIPLIFAVKNGHTECTKMLLEKGANVHFRSDGKTPLILACEIGRVEVVKLLLEYNADVNHHAHGLFRDTPLTCAVKNGHTECTKMLLENGANVHLRSMTWDDSCKYYTMKTPLILASENHYVEVVKLLLEYGANIDHCGRLKTSPLLIIAVKNGLTKFTKMLLEKGADVHIQSDGKTPLMLASERGHIEDVKLLLKYDTDASSRARLSAIKLAYQCKHTHVVEVFIKHMKDNPDTVCNTLKTLIKTKNFHIACLLVQDGVPIDAGSFSSALKSRNLDIMEAVLKNAKEDLVCEMNGDLVKAAVDGDDNFAKLLLPFVRNVNVPLESGNTALVEAAKCGNKKHMELLLHHGARANIQSKSSSMGTDVKHFPRKALIQEIIEGRSFDIACLLVQGGAPVDTGSFSSALKSRNPAIMTAVLKNAKEDLVCEMNDNLLNVAVDGDYDFAKLLLPYVQNVNVQLESGNTALEEAAKHGKKEHMKLLLHHGAKANIQSVKSTTGTDVDHFPEKTPLQEIIEGGSFDIASLLIQGEAPIDVEIFSSALKSRNPTIMGAVLKNAKEDLLCEMNGDLVKAAVDGDYNFAKLILPYVRNVNVPLESGNTTALAEAAKYGKKKHVELLLQHGAQANIQEELPFPEKVVLQEVIKRKSFDIACLLIQEGAPIDVRSFSSALKSRNPAIMSAVLKNAEEDFVRKMNGDLVQTAVNGDYNFAKLLLPHISDINILLKSGNTALMEAAKQGKQDHVKLFLDHGARVNTQNKNGYTALMMASQGGHIKCVEQLLTHKDIDINLQDNNECTALMLASKNGNTKIVQVLLANNANLEFSTPRNCSALFYGIKSNSFATVKLLLDKGADVLQETVDGKDVIQFAYECHKKPNHRIIRMIQEAQAKASHNQDDRPTLTKAFQLIFPLAHEWYKIGAELKIPHRGFSGADQDCLREILKEWLSRAAPRPTWSSLAKAVEPYDPNKAEEIRQKYCKNKLSPSTKTHQTDEDQHSGEEESQKNDNRGNSDDSEGSEDESTTENADDQINEEHFVAIEKAMKEKGTLKHTLSHGVMVGPARSGKSSLMSRLAGEMPISPSPSTGVADKVVQVGKSYSIALGVHETIWFKLLYDQEAIRLMKLASQNVPPHQPQEPAAPLTDHTVTLAPNSMQSEPESITSTIVEESHGLLSSTMASDSTIQLPTDTKISYPEGYVAPMEVFKGAIKGKGLESLQQHFENSWSFYLTDSGGQVEFQELLPLLVSGPSVFFFTFRLNQDLNQRFTIEYHLPDGGRSEPYQSTLTVVEAILQTLASVASMGTFTYKGPKVRSASLRPKMFIVGTHKDKLDPATADSEIKRIDQHLQEIIKSTSHFQEKIVQFASKSQLIYTVNNFSEDDSDFIKIRLGVERVVCRKQYRVHFPTHWLIFSLVLRQEMIKDSIISYEQCFSIAQDCGITDYEELNHALWFLHTKIGLIRHFPTPGLNDFVIRDPQILFDMVTKLVVNTFTFEKAGMPSLIEFEKKGVFTLKDYLALQEESPPLLPPEKLLHLLEQLQIIAPFQEDDQKKFFIPCVLAHSDEIDSQSSPQSSEVPPLLITFKCGYCPKGLPGALITHLITNKIESKFKWVLKTGQIFRNQVSFLVSTYDIITLKIHPTLLELTHSLAREPKHHLGQSIFSEVCSHVQNSIKNVSFKMNLTSNADHSLSFYCQNTDCVQSNGPHPATEIVKDRYGAMGLLCKNLSGNEISDLPDSSLVWLKSVEHSQETRNSSQHPDAVEYHVQTTSNTSSKPISEPLTSHNGDKDKELSDIDAPSNKLKSQVSHTDNTELIVEVGEYDWAEITRYLKKVGRRHIIQLGAELGLSIFSLEDMKDLPDNMVTAWLRKDGKVKEKCGDPLTWNVLVDALKRVGMEGIADNILGDKCRQSGSNQGATNY